MAWDGLRRMWRALKVADGSESQVNKQRVRAAILLGDVLVAVVGTVVSTIQGD